MSVDFNVRGYQGGGLLHWRKRYSALWPETIKCLDGFVSYKCTAFTSQDINWWTGLIWITCGLLWCFYQLFGLSFWRHPFTAEDPLVSKWCITKFIQICSNKKTFKNLVNFQQIFIFWWIVPLKLHHYEKVTLSPPIHFTCFWKISENSPIR